MLFFPIISASFILFTFYTGSAEAQDPGVVGTIEESVGNIGRNLSCAAIHGAVRAAIAAHPDWQQWLYELRQNQSDHIEICAESENGDIREFLDQQTANLRCPESRSRLMTVSIIFIVGFIIATALAVTFGILLYRK